ncbi:MAG: hypothetical protein LBE55_00100 [Clostridiales bacterium]|jgi:YbbR domain-containing protein|nr:hypothetical protein [Clostridiales bacterium]
MKKILSKLKSNFLTNLPWKIVAFFMAFVLWFLILNVEDPVRTETVAVTLELRNEDALAMGEGIHLENIEALRAQTIRFQVWGTSRGIDSIRNTLGAYIDLSTSEILAAAQNGETLVVAVQPTGETGPVDIFGFNPSSVSLVMDTITTIEMDVEPYTPGEVAQGFILLDAAINITPNVITVTGPTSIVDRIENLVATVDVSEASSSIFEEGWPIVALDGAGVPVVSQHLQFENSANIEVPIYRRGEVRVLRPAYHALPPEGFGILNINWGPQLLEVAGEEGVMAALAPIMLAPIPDEEIMQHTYSFMMEYDIRASLPQGVFLIDPRFHTVYVEVIIEPFVEQEFTISAEDIETIGLPADAHIVTEEITIRLSALQSIMAEVAAENITLTAVATGIDLEVGYNEVPLVFALPGGVSLMDEEAGAHIIIYVEEFEEEEEDIEEQDLDEDEEEGD